jgi:D-alanine-D-alanine ligase
MSDEVWAMWSPDPEDWKPINHSCDPSAWFEGLDLVARRDLEPGDEITMDYATFCTEPMAEFDCACGAPECRSVIRGSDHLEDFVERYGSHLSDHVRRKREEAARAPRLVGEELVSSRGPEARIEPALRRRSRARRG